MNNSQTLSVDELQGIQGGQIETCRDFQIVIIHLRDTGHNTQAGILVDLYYDQFCGGMYV
jgi:hypothetical protein